MTNPELQTEEAELAVATYASGHTTYDIVVAKRPLLQPLAQRVTSFSVENKLPADQADQLFAFSAFIANPQAPERFLARDYGVSSQQLRRSMYALYDDEEFTSLFLDFHDKTDEEPEDDDITGKLSGALDEFGSVINPTEQLMVKMSQANIPAADIARELNYQPRSLDVALSRVRKKAQPFIEGHGLVYTGDYCNKSLTGAVRANRINRDKFLRHWVSSPKEVTRYFKEVKWRVVDEKLIALGYRLVTDIATHAERKRLDFSKYAPYLRRSRNLVYILPDDLAMLRELWKSEPRIKTHSPEEIGEVILFDTTT